MAYGLKACSCHPLIAQWPTEKWMKTNKQLGLNMLTLG